MQSARQAARQGSTLAVRAAETYKRREARACWLWRRVTQETDADKRRTLRERYERHLDRMARVLRRALGGG